MTVDFQRPTHGGNLQWAATLVGCSPQDLLDFSASINPLGPPVSAIAAIQDHLGNLRTYPDPTYALLRQQLAQRHQVPLDWIALGNGCAELLTWAGRDLSQCSLTHVLGPSFGDYHRALKSFNAKVQVHSLNLAPCAWQDHPSVQHRWETMPFTPLPTSLLAIDKPNSMGILINSPHNPTGQLFDLLQLMSKLKAFGLVVVDEAFMDFLDPNAQASLGPVVQDYPNLVILRSLTKFYSLPGLRLGYAIAHPQYLQRWQKWRDPWPVNTLAIAAGMAILQDRDFQQQTWEWLIPARKQLFQGLSQLPGLAPLPGTANFLLVHSTHSVTQLQAQLLQHHRILIRDCLSFQELGDRYFRVAVRTSTENQQLLDGLASILPKSSSIPQDSP